MRQHVIQSIHLIWQYLTHIWLIPQCLCCFPCLAVKPRVWLSCQWTMRACKTLLHYYYIRDQEAIWHLSNLKMDHRSKKCISISSHDCELLKKFVIWLKYTQIGHLNREKTLQDFHYLLIDYLQFYQLYQVFQTALGSMIQKVVRFTQRSKLFPVPQLCSLNASSMSLAMELVLKYWTTNHFSIITYYHLSEMHLYKEDTY